MKNLTHDWLVSKGFLVHKSTKITLYSRDGFTYVDEDDEKQFGLRVQNLIKQRPISNCLEMITFHKIVTGIEIV